MKTLSDIFRRDLNPCNSTVSQLSTLNSQLSAGSARRQLSTLQQGERRSAAFTLLEVLSVVGIIALLMGLVGSAAFSARQRSYTATATAEAQQIAAALRAYYIAYREWPSGIGAGETKLDKNNMRALLGENSRGAAFMQLPPDRFDEDTGDFLDPWGHPYVVQLEEPEMIEADTAYEAVVSFPIQFGAYWQRF